MNRFTIFVMAFFLTLCPSLHAMSKTPQIDSLEAQIPWNIQKLSISPKVYPAPKFEKDGVKAFFYEALPYRGKPSRVFAYYGIPKVKKGQKVPAVVCVHGGGGTAFDDWVRKWNEHGYAAIAMDLNGRLPIGKHPKRPTHKFSGPIRQGIFFDISEPVEDQWMYHAVADVMLAHSLISSFAEVDPERTGLTGISWGGIISSIVMGVDKRFKFAVPVYGCGYLFESENQYQSAYENMTPAQAIRCAKFWDGSSHLFRAEMPNLWINGTNDKHFFPPIWQKSYQATPGETFVCMKVRMSHGGVAGWSSKEIYAFADSVVKNGKPLASFIDQGRTDRQAWGRYTCDVPVKKAVLVYTKDNGQWSQRKWQEDAAQLNSADKKVTATLPEGTAAYFFNLVDERDLIVSSPHATLKSTLKEKAVAEKPGQ